MSLTQPTSRGDIKEVAVIEPELLQAMTAAERSWAPVYERLYPRLCRSAARLIGADAAEDVVQEGLLEVFRKWHTLMPEERTDPFILKSVRFRVLDERRRQKRRVEYSEELEKQGLVPVLPAPDEINAAADAALMLEKIIAAMPTQRRAVCLLVYEDGLTIREAAAALGIGYETARTHAKLAHLWLRKHTPPELVDRLLGAGMPPRLPRTTAFIIAAKTEATND